MWWRLLLFWYKSRFFVWKKQMEVFAHGRNERKYNSTWIEDTTRVHDCPWWFNWNRALLNVWCFGFTGRTFWGYFSLPNHWNHGLLLDDFPWWDGDFCTHFWIFCGIRKPLCWPSLWICLRVELLVQLGHYFSRWYGDGWFGCPVLVARCSFLDLLSDCALLNLLD